MAMIAATTAAVLPGQTRIRIPTMRAMTPPTPKAVRMPLTAALSALLAVVMGGAFLRGTCEG
jgi:hypothetical protein